jgi:hypothetical protein
VIYASDRVQPQGATARIIRYFLSYPFPPFTSASQRSASRNERNITKRQALYL